MNWLRWKLQLRGLDSLFFKEWTKKGRKISSRLYFEESLEILVRGKNVVVFKITYALTEVEDLEEYMKKYFL